ncbi:MAG: hypothetical protein ABSD77_09305 [Verrucomicrobiota bacterium]|jgi:hypothetical protein
MDADEREIFRFLKSWGSQFIAAREICRRAGGRRRAQEEPDWAMPTLLRMAGRGILESDATGHFRIKPVSRKDRNKLLVEPDIAKIPEDSGVKAEDADDIAPDEYYDQL